MPGRALHTFDRNPSFCCRRSIRSFNSLLGTLLDCGHLEKIHELCRGLDALDLKPDACTYNILIRWSSSLERAQKLFDEMRSKGIELSVVSFGTLISAFCNKSKLEEDFEREEEMLKLGKVEEALSLRKEIVGLDSAFYSTVIHALFKAGQ